MAIDAAGSRHKVQEKCKMSQGDEKGSVMGGRTQHILELFQHRIIFDASCNGNAGGDSKVLV